MQIGVLHLYSDILELVYYLETKLNIISIWRRTIMKTTNNDFLSMVGVITTIVYCLQARWLVGSFISPENLEHYWLILLVKKNNSICHSPTL